MSKRIKYQHLIITHTFADGRVMTNEEFMSKPFVVDYEKNKDIYMEAQRIFDPSYLARERELRRIESLEIKKIQEKKIDIKNQLNNLETELSKHY